MPPILISHIFSKVLSVIDHVYFMFKVLYAWNCQVYTEGCVADGELISVNTKMVWTPMATCKCNIFTE